MAFQGKEFSSLKFRSLSEEIPSSGRSVPASPAIHPCIHASPRPHPAAGDRQLELNISLLGERGSPRVSQGTAHPLVLQKPPHACAYISRILALQAILQPTLTLPIQHGTPEFCSRLRL